MGNEGRPKRQSATISGPQPGSYPLGSEKSRAAARAVLEARATGAEDRQLRVALVNAGHRFVMETDKVFEILQECGYLSRGATICLLDFDRIPHGLDAAGLEQFLREHGADLCGPK